MQRHEWEDALIDAQTAGRISNGALLVALKLARAINWAPKTRPVPGLYWKNETAFEHVGVGRSTVFKHRAELFEAGFFQLINNNWIPTMPQSTVETDESTLETTQSTLETEKSTGDNPFSEDTYTEDKCSDDTSSEDSSSVQDGDQNRGCDGNEPTGTQTASQHPSDLTKKGEDMNPSSDFKTNTAEKTALKVPSSDSKTNAAPEPEASLDSKTSSADSDSLETPNWLIFKEPKTELCQHDKIGFCRKCDTADLADLQDAVSLL